ncbi:MAG: DUF2029 domain-containing protein [Eubacterium sp.]|nr:DUF2029 domain-containing protein [Eubacterium sp.]
MKLKNLSIRRTYVVLSLSVLVVATLLILFTNGKFFQVFFFPDPNDTGMDFFNQLIAVHTRKPYTQYGNLYPPLTNFFFYLLQLMIPSAIKEGWPSNHTDTMGFVGTTQDLRLHQSALLIFLFHTVLAVLCIFLLLRSLSITKKEAFCLTFSFGVLTALERGNVILIAFILLLIFIKNYQSTSPVKKEVALIALAASFGFKLYPALFGILLLKDRQFFAAIRAALYGVLFTILPMLFFDGWDGFSLWLNTLLRHGGVETEAAAATIQESSSPVSLHLIILVILAIILLTDLFFAGKLKYSFYPSQRLFLITTLMLTIVSSTGSYNLIFYILPFTFFLKETKELRKSILPEFIVYLFLLLPLGINYLDPWLLPLFAIGCVLRHQKAQ